MDDGSAGTLHRLDEFADCAEVRLRVLDIRHRAELIRLVMTERPWGVVHLAARHFIPDCETVFASTADVYAPSDSPHSEHNRVGPQGVYGWSKLLGERLLCEQTDRLGDCESVIARLFNVYGPGDPHPHLLPEILRQARRGRVLHLGDLGAARDFVYVDDVAEALVILLRRAQPGVVNVGTGTAVSGRELVDLVASLTGRHLEARVDAARLRRRSRPVSCAAADRLREIVPWWPRTRLHEGIRHTITAGRCAGHRSAGTWPERDRHNQQPYRQRPTRRAPMSAATTEIIARAVIRRDGQLLLVRQRTKSWSFLPGGHVEPGERVEAALVRELAEELGTGAKVAGFVGAVEHGYVEDGVTHHELNLIFDVAIDAAEPVSQEDHLEFRWLPLDQLADANVRPSALKNALVAADDERTPFWHGWNG
ncbi:NAD-dependent epimerase/dehydratase family protein [Saccharomonospora xinjiangensis]|uniref:NAD-dependent epimerase/dehydratase family protein n=1 Tax=Saccharomonospora xinjiangensis TaxID=75294 RepID=UPI0039E77C63